MTTHFADKHFASSERLAMHRHREANVTLVLSGTYEEQSVDGRFRLPTGSLIYHPGFHAHANHFETGDALVLNMELHQNALPFEHYCAAILSMDEMQVLAPLMRSDKEAALDLIGKLIRRERQRPAAPPPWMAFVARALVMCRETVAIKDIATRLKISPEHLSRAFQNEFGVTPSAFRTEVRIRRALASLRHGCSLADTASSSGFSDQSHMGRTMKSALGLTPAMLREMTAI